MNNKTELHLAVDQNDIEKVRQILSLRNGIIDKQDGDGNTALVLASTRNEEITKLLLDQNANVHIQNRNGRTALLFAADYLKIPQLKSLLAHGADVNAANNRGMNALMLVVESNDSREELVAAIIKILIEAGINLKHCNNNGDTALNIAIMKGKLSSVKLLIQPDTDLNILNSKQQNLLHLAIRSPKILSFLLTYNLYIHQKDSAGNTPLDLAVTNKYLESAKILEQFSPPPKNGSFVSGKELLQALNEKEYEKVVSILDTQHPDLSLTDSDGMSALLLAIKIDSFELIKKLIEAGADINHKNHKKESGLELAYKIKNIEIFGFLLQKGADANTIASNGDPLLNYCMIFPKYSILLIDAGAIVDEIPSSKCTFLLRAVREGSLKLVSSILNKSKKTIDILTPVGKEQYTPLFYAVRLALDNPKKYNRIVECLLQAKANPKIVCVQGFVVPEKKTCYELGQWHPMVKEVLDKYMDPVTFDLKEPGRSDSKPIKYF